MPHRFKKHRDRSRFLVFDILKLTFLVPLSIVLITEIKGPNLHAAFRYSLDHITDHETASSVWGLLILVNVILYSYLRPVFLFSRSCRRDCIPGEDMKKKAARIYTELPKFILVLTTAVFCVGGIFDYLGRLDDVEISLPFFFTIMEALATGLFTGMILYVNVENLLFPSRKIVFAGEEIPGKFSSFYFKLMISMVAVAMFLFFQIFNSVSSFYMIGAGGRLGPLAEMGVDSSEIFHMSREHEGLKDVLKVLYAKSLLFCLYVVHILHQIKKMFKNPLDTVQAKLEGLNADNPELSKQIDIVNNDEFTCIYTEINKLIDKQNTLLKSSEEKLESIVEYAADPIVSFHGDGTIHLFNPAAEEFFGYSEEEAQNKSIIDFVEVPDEARDNYGKDRNVLIKYLANLDSSVKRFTGIHKSGKHLPVEVNLSRSDTDHGTHITAIIRDIAGQLEFEENLKKARVNAEKANRMKSEFLANMSHELRTPLNAVLGFTQLLSSDKNLTQGQLDKIGTISRSGEHLLGLINDILDISKIESGKTELHDEIFDLNQFVADIKDMFLLKCKSKGLSFYVEFAGEVPPYVVGDLGKLRQILINLIGNAVKFTNEGGISLLVGEENGRIRFSVNDTGRGIPEDEIDRILQPFMQSSHIDHEGGTGLGLAITNSFIKLMGGKLEIESSEGSGSTFSFSLPLKVSDQAPVQVEDRGKVLAIKGNRAVKALIVDDKVNNRLILKTMLENVGFVTMEAADGKQAIERTEEFDPEMIFMDIKMPVMDGYEAVERLKATEQGKNITIFALTASAFTHDEKRIAEAGFDGFLPKPFKLESLFNIIADTTDVDFEYDKESTAENTEAPNADELDLQAAAALLSDEEIESLDDNVLINDFAAIKAQADSFGDRDGLKDLVAILKKYADNFNDSLLEELIEGLKEGKNNG